MNETCFACRGPYHPDSGHIFFYNNQPYVAYCGPCYRNFLKYMKSHMNRKWGKTDFYQEAANCTKFPNNPLDNKC